MGGLIMFAFLGLGFGEIIVLGVLGAIIIGIVAVAVTISKAISRPFGQRRFDEIAELRARCGGSARKSSA